MTMIESTLKTASLCGYCTGEIKMLSLDQNKVQRHWMKANSHICSILTINMTKEVVGQIGHIRNSAEIWSEAHRLFIGQTLTD
jgi:hypothetical protein